MSDLERQDERDLWRKLKAGPPARLPADPCPDELSLASYVDGLADSGEIRRIEAHLALCQACLDTVLETRRLLAEPARIAPPSVAGRAKALVPPLATVASAARPGRLLWRISQWAAAAVAALAVSYAGFQAGSATYRTQQARSALVAQEASFGLDEAGSLAGEAPFLAAGREEVAP